MQIFLRSASGLASCIFKKANIRNFEWKATLKTFFQIEWRKILLPFPFKFYVTIQFQIHCSSLLLISTPLSIISSSVIDCVPSTSCLCGLTSETVNYFFLTLTAADMLPNALFFLVSNNEIQQEKWIYYSSWMVILMLCKYYSLTFKSMAGNHGYAWLNNYSLLRSVVICIHNRNAIYG